MGRRRDIGNERTVAMPTVAARNSPITMRLRLMASADGPAGSPDFPVSPILRLPFAEPLSTIGNLASRPLALRVGSRE
jgi:hypothetical protein